MTNVELNETVKIVNNIENLAEISLGVVKLLTSNKKYIRLPLSVNRIINFPREAISAFSHKNGF